MNDQDEYRNAPDWLLPAVFIFWALCLVAGLCLLFAAEVGLL
jgi:hypothetical protein